MKWRQTDLTTLGTCFQITNVHSTSYQHSTFCYYHIRYHWPELNALPNTFELRKTLPTLEDANSIQMSLANVMERLLMEEIDHKTAALMLYALQTASMNLKRTSLEPDLPTQVVIDRASVATRPIGATAWSRFEGREFDDLTADDLIEDNLSAYDLTKASNHKQPALCEGESGA